MEIVVSTRNQNKFKEISLILRDAKITALNLNDFGSLPEVVENGKTFADNACKKALKIAKITKRLTVADDSGLCVEALNGAPGVYSARFSGKGATYASNNKKLLALLEGLPKSKRKASFICSVAVADAKGIVQVVEGQCRGFIAEREKGKEGFGYDPVFIYPALNKTFAEIDAELKNKLSHRAKAFARAKKVILRYARDKKIF